MSKQWSEPKLFNLSAGMTEEQFGTAGADAYWDGISQGLDTTHGQQLQNHTGS